MGQGLGSDLFAEAGEGGADHQDAQCCEEQLYRAVPRNWKIV